MMHNNETHICTRCVMDSSAAGTRFDDRGICNHCLDFEQRAARVVFALDAEREAKRRSFIDKVKREGQGKRYDCIIGLSGGVDSSYVIHLAKAEGLRPLAVHMDNNWNSELAVNNIKNLVSGLEVDLYTHVIDWPEYRGLMQSFFDADVIDIELLYDNAMLAVNYQQARRYGIKYILSGSNSATEGMAMPEGWNWFKWDKRNIQAIGRRGDTRIKTFPIIGTLGFAFNRACRGIQWAPFLDFYDYQKDAALNLLEDRYAYKRYPYKHYESIFTRFYQGFILPEKFGVDKRKLHLSTLIMSGQMSREQAVELLQAPPYASEDDLQRDRKYFLKRMGWAEADLERYLARPEQPHDAYPSEKALWEFVRKVYHAINKSI